MVCVYFGRQFQYDFHGTWLEAEGIVISVIFFIVAIVIEKEKPNPMACLDISHILDR